jgi:hypothetical protein
MGKNTWSTWSSGKNISWIIWWSCKHGYLTHYGELHKLFDTNFLDYTSYVIRERAIPDVADG